MKDELFKYDENAVDEIFYETSSYSLLIRRLVIFIISLSEYIKEYPRKISHNTVKYDAIKVQHDAVTVYANTNTPDVTIIKFNNYIIQKSYNMPTKIDNHLDNITII